MGVMPIKSLVHRGVLVPSYEWKGLHLFYRGRRLELNPVQEEMAVAFGRHLLAGRGEDRVFVRNFLTDFCKALGIPKDTELKHFDFSPHPQVDRGGEEEEGGDEQGGAQEAG